MKRVKRGFEREIQHWQSSIILFFCSAYLTCYKLQAQLIKCQSYNFIYALDYLMNIIVAMFGTSAIMISNPEN